MRGIEQIPWIYDTMLWVAEKQGMIRWRKELVARSRGRTLDLGTGTGRNLPLFPAGQPVVGVDPAWEPLRRARRRAPGVPLVRARAEALPFRAGAFESVVTGLMLCSVSDPAVALGEAARVLAPGGALCSLEHVRSRSVRGTRLQDFIQPAWTWIAGGCHPNRDTEASVRAAGFRIETQGYWAEKNWRGFTARPIGLRSTPVLTVSGRK